MYRMDKNLQTQIMEWFIENYDLEHRAYKCINHFCQYVFINRDKDIYCKNGKAVEWFILLIDGALMGRL